MRTYIQIDVQNLFFSAKDIKKRIDFKRIRDHFYNKKEDDIVGLNAYIIRTPDAKSDKFEERLISLDYNLIIKKATIIRDHEGNRIYKNTDQDIAICIDCLANIDKYDRWVLMSGDGDFVDLCKYLKNNNKFIEIWSIPGSGFNKRFCDYADQITFMNDQFFFDEDNRKKGS
jgi:uncharacterized LabA/DUF88 family protein